MQTGRCVEMRANPIALRALAQGTPSALTSVAVNRIRLLLLSALIIWFAATASSLVTARQTGGQSPTPQQAAAQLPPGYVGSDTCVLCHDTGRELTHSQHGQARNPRSPAATLGCESCHGPGKAHVDDENKGNMRKFKQMKPDEISGTCLSCHNRGNHAGWDGSAHEARNLSCTTCHSVHTPKSTEPTSPQKLSLRHVS